MSTTRSQLYRFARDLGNIEAVEHGLQARWALRCRRRRRRAPGATEHLSARQSPDQQVRPSHRSRPPTVTGAQIPGLPRRRVRPTTRADPSAKTATNVSPIPTANDVGE